MHRAANRVWSLTLACLLVLVLDGCGAVGYWDGPGGRSCKASCRTLAADGKSCVDWAATASDACVGKYTAVDACCDRAGNQMCILDAPFPKGFACYCRALNPLGFVVAVPGMACDI